MTKLEKAIRYLCLFDTEFTQAKVYRYDTIKEIVIDNNEEILDIYAEKYDKIIEQLA